MSLVHLSNMLYFVNIVFVLAYLYPYPGFYSYTERATLKIVDRLTDTLLILFCLPAGAPEGCHFAAAGPNNVRQAHLTLTVFRSHSAEPTEEGCIGDCS